MAAPKKSSPEVLQARNLLQNFDLATLPPVLLICPGMLPYQRDASFEPYLAERLLDKIVAAAIDPSLHDLAYSSFYAEDAKIGEIAMEAETLPFLAERRVIVVRHAERYMAMGGDKRSPLSPLLRYLENPTPSTLMIFVADGMDRRKKFYNACKDQGYLVECPQLKEAELQAWVTAEVSAKGKTIANDAVRELLARSGERLGDVNNAVSVVMTYVGEQARITEADVLKACADVAEESIWALTDAIANSKPAVALRSLHQLMDHGKSHDEIIGTINWLIENAYRASPQTQAQTKSPFVTKRVLPLADNLGLARLKEALAACTRTQFKFRSTGEDKDLALELLVIRLSAPRGRRKPGAA